MMTQLAKGSIADGSVSQQCTNYCTIMVSQLELLLSFVEDLLDLRQLGDRLLDLAKEPVNIQEIIKGVCETFNPQANAKKVQISYEIERVDEHTKEIPPLFGDKRRIKQVLMNLIKNALKFTM